MVALAMAVGVMPAETEHNLDDFLNDPIST
jgi:hypothetical protein